MNMPRRHADPKSLHTRRRREFSIDRGPRALLAVACLFCSPGNLAAQRVEIDFGRTTAARHGGNGFPTPSGRAVSGDSVYIAWGVDFKILFRASQDGGLTFGPTLELDMIGCNVSPIVAAQGDHVWVVHSTGCPSGSIVLWRSADRGATFDPVPMVLQTNVFRMLAHSIHALPNGRLVVVWSIEGQGTAHGIRVAISDDSGETFTTRHLGGHSAFATRFAADWSDDGSRVSVGVAKAVNPVQYIVSTTTDRGDSWPSLRIDDDAVSSSISHPRLDSIGDDQFFSWIEDGDVWFRRLQSGVVLGPILNLTASTGGAVNAVSLAAIPSANSANTEVHVVWQDSSTDYDPFGKAEVVHRVSGNGGQSFGDPRSLSGSMDADSRTPSLLKTDHFVVLHWNERPTGRSRRAFRALARGVPGADFEPPAGVEAPWLPDTNDALARLVVAPEADQVFVLRPVTDITWLTSWTLTDCDGNGVADIFEILGDPDLDCNLSKTLDSLDVEDGSIPCSTSSADIDEDLSPDECVVDCDGDLSTSTDADEDGLPDECQDDEEDCNPLSFSEQNISNSGAASTLPRVATWGDRVHAAWSEGGVPTTRTFTDDGGGILLGGAPVSIDESGQFPVTNEIAIAVQADDVHVAWRFGATSVFHAVSRDAGASFNEPELVYTTSRLNPVSLRAFATPGGRAFIAWNLHGDARGHFRVAASDDAGESFTVLGARQGRLLNSPRYAATVVDESLHATLVDQLVRHVEVAPTESGQFVYRDQLIRDATPVNNPTLRGPRIAANASGIWLLWKEDGDLFATRSLDGGKTFARILQVDEPGGGRFDTNGHDVFAYGDEVVILWADKSVDPFGKFEVHARKSYNRGQAFAGIQNLSRSLNRDSNQAAFLANDDRLVAIWDEAGMGRRARFSAGFGNAYSPGVDFEPSAFPTGTPFFTDRHLGTIRSQNGEIWIAWSLVHDCNDNGIPDACEPDSDGDGAIDDCDCDGDNDGDELGAACDCDDESAIAECNTQPGDNVVVCGPDGGFCVTFSNVIEPGETTIFAHECRSAAVEQFRDFETFRLIPPREPVCYIVETTAVYEGEITACIVYDDSVLLGSQERNLKLIRCEDDGPCGFPTIVEHDLDADRLCVEIDGFSVFVLGFPEDDGARMQRGDCNNGAGVDISDAIFALQFLFLGGEPPVCSDACDANDDGEVDITDAIATLSSIFLGAGELPPPGASDCGEDPTEDTLECERSTDACAE